MRLDPASGEILAGELTLKGCYEFCRQSQRAHSRTYYFSTQLFPKDMRPHVHALYAFMRYADEIVDSPGALSPEEQLAALERFEADTIEAITGEQVKNPILRAFSNTVRARDIDLGSIKAFMESMKMDTRISRYETYEDLKIYTYGSAAVVGLMMCRVAGVRDDRSTPHAEALGEAMQLTNFLRDIGEDWKRGRVYVPLEDLRTFGYAEEEIGAGVADERFVALMKFEVDRARQLYSVADEGMDYLPKGRRYPVVVARELYAAILGKIEEQGYDVYSKRAETSLPEKLRVALRCAARDPGELLARGRAGGSGEIAIPS